MDNVTKIIIVITIIVGIYVIIESYARSINRVRIWGSEISWFIPLISIAKVAAITAIYYYVFPMIFEGDDLIVAILSAYTISNFAALFLSWFYFNNTHCWRDEGNPITRKLMFNVGEDIGHFIAFILRLGVNIFFVYILTSGMVYFDPAAQFDVIYFIYSASTAVYTFELAENIVSNFSGEVYICKNTSKLCKTYGIACDVPAFLKEKVKK